MNGYKKNNLLTSVFVSAVITVPVKKFFNTGDIEQICKSLKKTAAL
jgi:hypothetical protein